MTGFKEQLVSETEKARDALYIETMSRTRDTMLRNAKAGFSQIYIECPFAVKELIVQDLVGEGFTVEDKSLSCFSVSW